MIVDQPSTQQMLKSAASSPSLAKNGVEVRKPADHLQKKKKSPRQSSASLTKHKRSASDGTSLSKMFHFKQQMMIQKFQQKSNQHYGNNSQNNGDSQNNTLEGKKNILIQSQIN